jgi:hypothetical protein
MQIAFGLSQARDLGEATREAARQALDQLKGGAPQAALILSSGGATPGAGTLAREVLGPVPVAGGAVDGLLWGGDLVTHGVAVAGFRSEEWTIQTACGGSAPTAFGAAERAARLILSGRPNRRRYPRGLALAFAGDGLVQAGEAWQRWRDLMGPKLKSVASHVPDATGLYCGAMAETGALAVLCLEGPGPVGVGVGLGWAPLTLTCAATRSDGTLLHELNGRPAAQVYTEALPASAQDPSRFPLGIAVGEDQWLIRSVVAIEGSALRLGGTLPAGVEVHLMAASANGLHQAARDAMGTALKRLEGQPASAILVVESAARWAVQDGQARREWEAIREQAPAGTPCLGWLAPSELVPSGAGQVAFQNGSIVVVAL